ncbi:MAG TPA: nucleotide exchange factor GrpE [Opitutaceae bacterium]|nr:nucleotide exchange factor GrpE [Opitutaceae bacterium]
MSRSEPTDTDPPSASASPGPGQPPPAAEKAAGGAAGKADELAAARKEAADNYDRYVRTAADLENFRRRTVREKEDLRLFASSRVLEDLLPVLDNLALGLTAAKQPKAEVKTLVGGVDLVLQQLKSALAGHGLKEINPAGAPFDPNLHEAISHQPSAEVAAEHVLTVVRTGYTLNGRLLRPAAVVVSSGAPAKDGGKA